MSFECSGLRRSAETRGRYRAIRQRLFSGSRWRRVAGGWIFFRYSPELTLWIEFQPGDRAAYDAIAAFATGLPPDWTVEWNHVSPWIGASLAIHGDLEHEAAMT